MSLPFFTIGHSDRTVAAFTAILDGAGVGRIVDVRKMPMSRANPQFNGPALAAALATAGIAYEHVAALGGLRGRAQRVAADVNGLWSNRSFHNYADHALSPAFHAAIDALEAEGRAQCLAVMCAEAVWWRCHRRIIADYLIARGETVWHIMGEGRLEAARLTPGAVVGPDGSVFYPAEPAA